MRATSENGKRVRDRAWYRALLHPGDAFRESEVFHSAIRHPRPNTPRGRALTSFQNFFLHLYPVKVPKEIAKTRTTLRLGFIATVLFAILFVSGLYLMFFYHPAVPDAYFDMHSLATSIAFGQFVRNVHRWSAHLMVLVVALHLLRVFYAGAYKAPRQFNWVIGVGLLVVTLLAVVHRLPAAVGPAGLLGDHRRHEHRRVRAAAGGPRPVADAGRERRDRGRARCASTSCTSTSCRRC